MQVATVTIARREWEWRTYFSNPAMLFRKNESVIVITDQKYYLAKVAGRETGKISWVDHFHQNTAQIHFSPYRIPGSLYRMGRFVWSMGVRAMHLEGQWGEPCTDEVQKSGREVGGNHEFHLWRNCGLCSLSPLIYRRKRMKWTSESEFPTISTNFSYKTGL